MQIETDFWNAGGFLYAVLSSAALVGVIVVTLTEVVKEFVFTRGRVNRRLLRWWEFWLADDLRRASQPEPSPEERWRRLVYRLEIGLKGAAPSDDLGKPHAPFDPQQDILPPEWFTRLVGPFASHLPPYAELARLALAAPMREDIRTAVHNASRGSLSYRPNQFVRSLEVLAKQVLERPSANHDLFRLFTFGSSQRDRLLVLAADFVRQAAPEQLRANDATADFREAVQIAQDAVALHVDRHLDQLQLSLAGGWRRTMRLTSLAASAATVYVLIVEAGPSANATFGWKDILAAVSIVLIGSYLASFFYDLLKAAGSLARTQ